MKFIIIQNKLYNQYVLYFFTFPKNINHIDFYISMVELLRKYYDCTQIKCVSAGFYNKETNHCFGKSETLSIECHYKTDEVIRLLDYIFIFDNPPLF